MKNKTIEQVRAGFALAFIGRQKQLSETEKNKLNTYIHKSPSLILQCGLGQTLAFLLADAAGDMRNPAWLLYAEVQIWLCGERDQDHPMRIYKKNILMNELLGGSRAEYFRAQEESLNLFDWLKKFAVAKL